VTDPSTLDQFTAEVVQVELIPVDRDFSAEENELFTDLECRLKAIRRARKQAAAPAPDTQALAVEEPVEQGPRQIRRELTEMAAKPRLKQKDVARLEQILTESGPLVAHDAEYQRLYQWALRLHKGAPKPTAPSTPRKGRRMGPAGLVQNPEFTYGGREVLGGLPSSRRGH